MGNGIDEILVKWLGANDMYLHSFYFCYIFHLFILICFMHCLLGPLLFQHTGFEKKIQILQNKAIRVISDSRPRDSITKHGRRQRGAGGGGAWHSPPLDFHTW